MIPQLPGSWPESTACRGGDLCALAFVGAYSGRSTEPLSAYPRVRRASGPADTLWPLTIVPVTSTASWRRSTKHSEGKITRRLQPSDPMRPRRIWILNHYAGTPDRAAGVRHYTLARAVVERGASATVFAASFSHGTGVDRLSRTSLVRSESVNGVQFVWLRTVPYRGNTWLRMLNMASYAVMVVLAEIGRPSPDVVVGSSVHPFAALAGWVIAKLRGATFMFEVRDIWPQTLIDIGAMSPRSSGARLLYAIEAFLTRRAATVITLLPGIGDYLESRGLPSAHVRYLPNGPDLAEFDAAVEGLPDREDDTPTALLASIERWRSDGESVFAYTGAHGRVNRLDVVLDAVDVANRTSRRAIRVLFVGEGPEKPGLMAKAASLGLDNVTFADPVPRQSLPLLLTAVDAGIVHTTRTPVYRYGISFNKLFDYMAARLPVVFATETAYDFVAREQAGLTVVPDDPRALAAALVAMAELEPASRLAMGQRGRAFVEREHDMAALGETFAEIVGVVDSSRV